MKTILIVLIIISLFLSIITEDKMESDVKGERYAKQFDCLESYKKGIAITDKISSLKEKDLNGLKITEFRGEIVSFLGTAAPPGATNDLISRNGFYIRVVNSENIDLRPKAVLWEVMVTGKILQVYPKNKIVVLDVSKLDWHLIQTF